MDKSKKLAIVLIGILVTMAISTVASAVDYPYTYPYSSGDAAAFLGVGMAVCAVISIIWLVIWILVGIWVYKDAEKRGKSGVLWLILVIILGIIGIIIWLVIRPPIGGEKTQPDRKCPNCGRPIPMDARVCPYCSKKFEE